MEGMGGVAGMEGITGDALYPFNPFYRFHRFYPFHRFHRFRALTLQERLSISFPCNVLYHILGIADAAKNIFASCWRLR